MTWQFLPPFAGDDRCLCVISSREDSVRESDFSAPQPSWTLGRQFILGHFRKIQKDATVTDTWREEFGPNYQIKGFFQARGLYTTDTKALNHILLNDHIYQKGAVSKRIVTDMLGNGLLAVEMEEHKRQNPAFGVPQLRELTGIFNQKSAQLRDIWSQQIGHESDSSRIDVFAWLRKATLDIIGEAGFNYQFNAMEPKNQKNALDQALTQLLNSPQSLRQAIFCILQVKIPILSIFPVPGGKVVKEARDAMTSIAKELLAESQAAIKASGDEVYSTRRDLLSLMVKSNMSKDQENARLSDADVYCTLAYKMHAEIPTFFVAGHETTSTATTLALHALSINPLVQKRLREELFSVASDAPSFDELNSLPLLENFVRETIAPISAGRQYLDRHGRAYNTIGMPKGTTVRIAITAVNRDKEIWGDDADVFRPERWENIPAAASAIPLNKRCHEGPHNCIGFRFAIVEMKSLLFALVRAFEFEPAVPTGGITFSLTPVMRPRVLAEPEGGNQLPLIVRPYVTI
ncbi:cytochrome P450 [Mycena olivaceomarginata]|nr:cytochrome P450 [Mycena olivaceomarginata]